MVKIPEAPARGVSTAAVAGSKVTPATEVPKEKPFVIDSHHVPSIRDLVRTASLAESLDERDSAAHQLVGYIGSLIDFRPWREMMPGVTKGGGR